MRFLIFIPDNFHGGSQEVKIWTSWLETISMFTDAYSRLIAYTFKFNLLSVTDPHYDLNEYTGVLLLPSGSTAMWWWFLMTMSLKSDVLDVGVRLLNLSLRLLQAQHSLSVVLLFIYILVSIKIEVDATTTKNALSSTTTLTFCGLFFLCFSWWYLFISSCCLLFLSRASYICFWFHLLMKEVYFVCCSI